MNDELDALHVLADVGKDTARRQKLLWSIERLAPLEAMRAVLLHLWYGPHSGGDFVGEIRELLDKGFVRASGESICSHCSQPYWRHPFATEYLSWDDQPYLHRLCDERLVKL